LDWNVGDLERSVSGGPIRSEKMDSSNVAPEYGVKVGVDSSGGLSHDFSG